MSVIWVAIKGIIMGFALIFIIKILGIDKRE